MNRAVSKTDVPARVPEVRSPRFARTKRESSRLRMDKMDEERSPATACGT
jgi:hypothetical protein